MKNVSVEIHAFYSHTIGIWVPFSISHTQGLIQFSWRKRKLHPVFGRVDYHTPRYL